MPENYLLNILNLLRLLKATGPVNRATWDSIVTWCGAEAPQSTFMKLAIYVQEQCEGANDVLHRSNLTGEAKVGLMQTVDSLSGAFQIGNLNSALGNFIPQIDSAISQFAIIVSLTTDDVRASENAELCELVEQVDDVLRQFTAEGIDPLVSDVAKRHLHVLSTMLRNVDALGLDSAIACYYEMIVRLKRVDDSASAESKAKTAGIWDKIKSWQERFASIDAAINTGSGLLAHGGSFVKLIGNMVS